MVKSGMSVEIVNLTEQLVNKIVDELIELWPDPTQKEYFQEPYVRQKLIAQMLNRSRSRYVVLQSSDKAFIQADSSIFLTEERIRLENLVHSKMRRIVKEKLGVRRRLNALYYTSQPKPSSWFG